MPWKSASSMLVSAGSPAGAGFTFLEAPSAPVTFDHLGKLMLESPWRHCPACIMTAHQGSRHRTSGMAGMQQYTSLRRAPVVKCNPSWVSSRQASCTGHVCLEGCNRQERPCHHRHASEERRSPAELQYRCKISIDSNATGSQFQTPVSFSV